MLAAGAQTARAQECANPGAGWLFCDDFESTTDQTGALGLWDDQGSAPPNLVITTNPVNVRSGRRALEMTAHKGLDTGGGPTKWFLPGADTIYARFYVKFDLNYGYLHHFVSLAANRASDKWSAFGMAGCRPSGSNFYISGLEPYPDYGANPQPGAWNFYSYFTSMMCDPGSSCANYANPTAICSQCASRGSPCSNGPECCWGSSFLPTPKQIPALARWYCMEMRLNANTGAVANGGEAMWIDGAKVGEWNNISWRTDDTLKVNALALFHYVTDDNYAGAQTQKTVWFDDIVVSTQPIGCLVGGNSPDAGSGPSDSGTGNTRADGAAGSGEDGAAGSGTDGAAGGGTDGGGTGVSGSCGCAAGADASALALFASFSACVFHARKRRHTADRNR
jgi:hypothetical protein